MSTRTAMSWVALAFVCAACVDTDALRARGKEACTGSACDPDAGDGDGDGDAATDAETPDGTIEIECEPLEEVECYTGPSGTRDEGVCRAGLRTCNAQGTALGPCEDQVLPAEVDDCDNDTDDDCNGMINDGFPSGEACACTPLAEEDCYTGPSSSLGVADCAAGRRSCAADGRSFGACEGETLPARPTCSSADADCNGLPDGEQDLDGDGFTRCDDDCCDGPLDGCDEPALFGPAAFDFPSNDLDEDCSGEADEPRQTCDDALASDSADMIDYARALDLCVLTAEDPDPSDPQFGLVSIAATLADGQGSPMAVQRSLRPDFGAIAPRVGSSLVVLSTGHAAATGDVAPTFASGSSTDLATTSDAPADWLAENDDAFPSVPGCATGSNTAANDPIMLTLRARAPINARAFAFDAYFLSTEYPEWVCSSFFDLFVALLDSSYAGTPENPDDKNLATFVSGDDTRYAVSVNLAQDDTGLFSQCMNGAIGCLGTAPSTTNVCAGSADLVGTGMDVTSGGCTGNTLSGGGTGWLHVAGNITPGELFTLRLAIWDSGDHSSDSLVLLDGFTWLEESVEPGITPN